MSSSLDPPIEPPCSVCGAPLTANASFCPECGASQRTYRAAPAPRSEGRRWWIPVAIATGGVAALLGGALLGRVLISDPDGDLAGAAR
ncbi:MAG: zinc ribbon domain-containing protein [Chloroflexi bacterium]|nr:zinc ribbon domain-containing protein [Chloroflexota bacterium]